MDIATNLQSPFYNFLIFPKHRVLRHMLLITALVFVTLNFAMPYFEHQVFGKTTLTIFLLNIMATFTITAYFTIYFLIPRYLLKKKYILFVGLLSTTVLLMLVIHYFGEIIFCKMNDFPPYMIYNNDSKAILILDVTANFFINLIAFTGGSVTILLKNWLLSNQKAAQLEEDQLRNEVEHLKEQLNPGFMFQTLHYAGTLEKNSPSEASDILMKLSRLLRYQLYDCNHNLVFLLSEIHYIEDYLLLEKTYSPGMSFTISTEGEINTTVIPPLLFIPFVQFMVGVMKTGKMHKTLKVEVASIDDNVTLRCCLLPEENSSHKVVLQIAELKKVSKRLKILFGDNYKLNFYGTDSLNIHSVGLHLNIGTE